MVGRDSVKIFPIRHLSPAGAWNLKQYLDAHQPEAVLIEGPSDAIDLIKGIVDPQTQPPLALMAYTDTHPVDTLLYPFAEYSPEYQALLWGKENNVRVEWIDLPARVFLALKREQKNTPKERTPNEETVDEVYEDELLGDSQKASLESDSYEDIRVRIAQSTSEVNYESFWERQFESISVPVDYQGSAYELGKQLREYEDAPSLIRAEDLVREAYMRRRIDEVMTEGVSPENIVVVCGAFHASALGEDRAALNDDELAQLPQRSCRLTLMPYSYYRLSNLSGYGAGNQAPAYFEMVWHSLQADTISELPARYLAKAAQYLRDSGIFRSSAEVIEGVRLANSLTVFRSKNIPVLNDLHDAAITLLGRGERLPVQESLARIDIGTSIGSVPKDEYLVSIQSDFKHQLKELKLEKYKSLVGSELRLDLRKNRRVKSESSAFLDLNRSFFFHRLEVLGIEFVEKLYHSSEKSWIEKWYLQWTPDAEIQLVESVLFGDSIEAAAAIKLGFLLKASNTIDNTSKLVRRACECHLIQVMEDAKRKLQSLSTENYDFLSVVNALNELSFIVVYGDVRRLDTDSLLPLVKEFFVQACLIFKYATNCNYAQAKELIEGIDKLQRLSLDLAGIVEAKLWERELIRLFQDRDQNPLLSGYACSLLVEQDLLPDETLSSQLSQRLSVGEDPMVGAFWFEGLSLRKNQILLVSQDLWKQLDLYVESLNQEDFLRVLVFLRRAFAPFSPHEKRSIIDRLNYIWEDGSDALKEFMETPLNEEEEDSLDALNDFDFDDL